MNSSESELQSSFANSLSDIGEHRFANACERYGMTWGCNTNCPVLRQRKCERQNDVNANLLKEIEEEENE